jgi:ATP-dependent Clp endopeptidase proteolytic subunit ClpP
MGTPGWDDESVIDSEQAAIIIKALHVLENEDKSEEITIIMSSAGGADYAGFGIYDAIKSCSCYVTIKVIGYCMSMATIVLQAADSRLAYPNTTFMIHEGSISAGDRTHQELKVETQEMERLVEKMYDIYEESLNISREEIKELCKVDYFFDAKNALKIGLIDEIIKPSS